MKRVVGLSPTQLNLPNRPVQMEGESDFEYDQRKGLVYLLTDELTDFARHAPVAIYTEPILGITHTQTDPTTWHHYLEHYWEDTGRWELTPYLINEPKEWARDEFLIMWGEKFKVSHPGGPGRRKKLTAHTDATPDEDLEWLKRAGEDYRRRIEQQQTRELGQ